MISINISELIWTVINFFLLLFLLNRFLYKPVISFMEERQARIDAKLREEEEAKKASVQNRKDAEAALSQRQDKTAQQLHEAAPELAALLTEKLLGEE